MSQSNAFLGGLGALGRDSGTAELAKQIASNRRFAGLTQVYDSFIKDSTSFSSLKALLESGGFHAASLDDIQAIPEEQLDAHIARVTKFKSWDHLVKTLAKERFV